MTEPPSHLWIRKDLQRIRSRLAHRGLDDAEMGYLRAWALLLAASDLPLDDEDRERLGWVVRMLGADRERAA